MITGGTPYGWRFEELGLGSMAIGRDFNITRLCGQKSGPKSLQGMANFKSLIHQLNLLEPPPYGRLFTWHNERQNPSQPNLPVALLLGMGKLVSFDFCKALPRILSDHTHSS